MPNRSVYRKDTPQNAALYCTFPAECNALCDAFRRPLVPPSAGK